MTDSDNIKGANPEGNPGEHLKRLQQQLVQKDNLIRLLQAQLKKQKESSGDSTPSGEQSSILANLESEIKRLNDELLGRESEINSLRQQTGNFDHEKAELKNEISGLRKQYEMLSENRSSAASSSDAPDVKELRERISELEQLVAKYESTIKSGGEENQSLRYKLETEGAALKKLRETLNEREMEYKRLQQESHSSGPYSTASIILEKHIKGGKYLPDDYPKLVELLHNIQNEMSKTIDDKEKENEKLQNKLKKSEESDSQNQSLAERNLQLEDRIKYLKSVSESRVGENYSEFKILVSHLIKVLDEFQGAFVLYDNNDAAGFKLKINDIYDMLKISLKTVDVHPIATIGEKYNSRVHEVVEYVRSKEHDDDTIVDETEKGYTLNEEIIRTAKVKVIKNRFKCGACGSISRVGSHFCDSCGSKLETLAVPYKDIKNTGSLYFQTGKVFEEKNMLEKSREYYQQAVALEPMNTNYLYNLARILEMLGEFDNAIDCFRKIPDTDPRRDEIRQHVRNLEIKINIMNGIKNITTYK